MPLRRMAPHLAGTDLVVGKSRFSPWYSGAGRFADTTVWNCQFVLVRATNRPV